MTSTAKTRAPSSPTASISATTIGIALAERRACVAHCPDSNFFLGSGVMPLAAATSRGVRTSLVTLLVDA